MIKTLKKRFIIFTMAAVTCLLLFLVFAINGLNWMMLESKSDVILKNMLLKMTDWNLLSQRKYLK